MNSFYKALGISALAAAVALATGCESTTETASATGPISKANVKSGFIKGADVSTLKEMEDAGFVYYDAQGNAKDALTILKENGFNYIRLRLWNDPYDAKGNKYGGGTNDLATDIALAKRAKALGMKFLLDFHYSDFWTDPGKQFKPKAWAKLSYSDELKALRKYTSDTIKAFVKAGAAPDMVQLGNEIASGLLFPEGRSWNDNNDGKEFDRVSELLKAAYAGVEDSGLKPTVMLHIDKGSDLDRVKWWYGEIEKRGVPYDVAGFSHYPFWDKSTSELLQSIDYVKDNFNKPVIIAETSYAYTADNEDAMGNQGASAEETAHAGYPATVAGQAAYFKHILEATSAKDSCQGVFLWEPAWKTGEGITWSTAAGRDYLKQGLAEDVKVNQWSKKDLESIDTWGINGNNRENHAVFDKDGHVLESIIVFND
ncbi:MAG: glycosyl hydrolase 53 family protein [Succinivibrio sp.]|nr:glycosyl hydrolase 53 family protein [Succinivibrio sp.]